MVKRETVLLPSDPEKVTFHKRASMGTGGALLGLDVTTPPRWAEGIWSLWGDGRPAVTDVQRKVLLLGAVGQRTAGAGFVRGAFPVAEELVKSLCGLPAFERLVDAAGRGEEAGLEALSPLERSVLEAIGCYYEELHAKGLVEPVRELLREDFPACCLRAPQDRLSLAGVHVLAPNMAELLARAGMQEMPADVAGERAVYEMRPVAGPTAVPAEVSQVVVEALGQGGDLVLVIAPDPEALCAHMPVRPNGAYVVTCRTPFTRTLVARAVAGAWNISHGADPLLNARIQAVDFAANPFSGADRFAALELDTAIRCDHMLSAEDIERMVEQACPGYAAFDVASQGSDSSVDPRFEELFGMLEGELASWPARTAPEGADAPLAGLRSDAALRSREYEALAVLRGFVEAGAVPSSIFHLAADVTIRGAKGVPGEPRVLYARLEDAASALASYAPGKKPSHVVVADATAGAYPISTDAGAADTMASKLGLLLPGFSAEKTCECQRERLAALFGAARESVCIVVPEHDAAGERTHLAPFFADALQEHPVAQDGARPAATRGEEALSANFGAPAAFEENLEMLASEIGDVGPEAVLARMRFVDVEIEAGVESLPVLSPSQIERYMDCPYAWYLRYCLGMEDLDEEFGSMAMGRIAHAVLEEFYSRALEAGPLTAPWSDTDAMADMLATLFDDVVAGRLSLEERLCSAANPIEQSELDRLKLAMVESAKTVQSSFLPGFSPCSLEVTITPGERAVFGGAVINGRVDRVDVDRQTGRFLVVDYKGSDRSDNDCCQKKLLEGKALGGVQTAVYAAVLEKLGRIPGSDVALGSAAGAFYLSYRGKKSIRGACADDVYDALLSNGLRTKRNDKINWGWGMSELFSLVEELVAQAVGDMCAGKIAPRAYDATRCRFCPAAQKCSSLKGASDE